MKLDKNIVLDICWRACVRQRQKDNLFFLLNDGLSTLFQQPTIQKRKQRSHVVSAQELSIINVPRCPLLAVDSHCDWTVSQISVGDVYHECRFLLRQSQICFKRLLSIWCLHYLQCFYYKNVDSMWWEGCVWRCSALLCVQNQLVEEITKCLQAALNTMHQCV